jgi:adenylate cyclase
MNKVFEKLIISKNSILLKSTYILLIFFIFSNKVFALEPVKLKDKMEGMSIGIKIEYFKDVSGKLEIENVISSKVVDNFVQSEQESLGFGYTSSPYWIRFNIENPFDKSVEWFLEVGYPHLDKIILFIEDDKGSFFTKTAGDNLPFYEREINYRNVVFPVETPPSSVFTYYLRIETTSSMNFPLRIWSPDIFHDYVSDEHILLGIYAGIMLIMFLYNLFVFFSVRDLSYFFYFLFIASFGIFQFSLHGMAYQYIWPNLVWWTNINQGMLAFISVALMGQFCRSFLDTKHNVPYLDKAILIAIIVSLSGIFLTFFAYGLSIKIIAGVALIQIGLMLAASIICLKKGSRAALFYLIAWTILLAACIPLALKYMNAIPSSFFTDCAQQIGSSLLVLLLSLGLADVINSMKKELEVYNTQLEHLVEERTRELKNTLVQVQTLKTQQDGDYFLTSLLIRPLGGDFSKSEKINVELLVRQKKKFIFRRWDSEIGGDLCAAYSIRLENRDYTVFINGDAMGKSMQGAGGALVFGTVFKAVVSRTQVSRQAQFLNSKPYLSHLTAAC